MQTDEKRHLGDAVVWAYRLILGREPESSAVVEDHVASLLPPVVSEVRKRFLESAEFTGQGGSRRAQEALAKTFYVRSSAAGEPGFFRDIFGIRTRTSFLPDTFSVYSGHVASPDGLKQMPLHDEAEIEALAKSALEASGSFNIVELGAGWGPFLVMGARMAQSRGLSFKALGVEGSSEHVEFMRVHFEDNGIEVRQQDIVHAVVGAKDGTAQFPKLVDPSANWGAEAMFNPDLSSPEGYESVRCITIATALESFDTVDFIHCDIQGAEAEAIEASIETIERKVRRMAIGTHSRQIECDLFNLLGKRGWILEHEQPCHVNFHLGKAILVVDGVQVWRRA